MTVKGRPDGSEPLSGGVTLASLARNFGWGIEDEESVHAAEGVLRSGGRVGYHFEAGFGGGNLLGGASGRVEVVEDLCRLLEGDFDAGFVVTNRAVEFERGRPDFPVAVIRPRNLALGLETQSVCTAEQVERLLVGGLGALGYAWKSVARLAAMATDPSLEAFQEFARTHGLPLQTFRPDPVRNPHFQDAETVAVLSAGGSPSEGAVVVSRTAVGPLWAAVVVLSEHAR